VTGELTYRLFQDTDLPGLLRLWEENTNWGKLTPEAWRQWYIDAPHGSSLVAVAEDENGDIAGQLVCTPSRAVVGDREVRAMRLSAQIVRKDLNRTSLRSVAHPIFGLYEVGEKAAVAAGFHLWYALPKRAWLPIVPLLSRFAGREIAVAEYPCLSVSLVSAPPVTLDEETGFLTAQPVTSFGARYEALWRSAKESFPIVCGVVRSPDRLRYNTAQCFTLEIRDTRNDTLVGYTAIRTEPPLLCDILARTPASLTPVLATTLKWLATQEGGATTGGMEYLDSMETPALGPALRTLGFTPVDYKFAFVCAALHPSLTVEAIAPEHWYITPVDH
jgi:hypothetical protein